MMTKETLGKWYHIRHLVSVGRWGDDVDANRV